MGDPVFSVVIPAHNEEKYIGKCLKAVINAAKYVRPYPVEIIVVANRCTDKTCAIARHYGARVLANDKNVLPLCATRVSMPQGARSSLR